MTNAERKARRQLFEELSEGEWNEVVAASDGFAGADIGECIRRVLEARVRTRATTGLVSAEEIVSTAAGVRRPF
jgi:hypothetical protein